MVKVSPHGLGTVTRRSATLAPCKRVRRTLHAIRVLVDSAHLPIKSITKIGAIRRGATQKEHIIFVMLGDVLSVVAFYVAFEVKAYIVIRRAGPANLRSPV